MRYHIYIFFAHFTRVLPLDLKECNRPLGLSTGRIIDSQISASSSFDLLSTGPQHSRVRLHTGSGAWCPLHQINSTTKEWIQVSFGQDMVISAIETQGRFDEGRGMEYPPAYRVEYWRPSLSAWAVYKNDENREVIPANTDTRTAVLRILDGGIVARRVRIIPVSNTTRTVCLRLELYGCVFKSSLQSYSISDGSSADGLSLRDSTYDGFITDNILSGGLGKLFDGAIGHDDFESHPHKWVGWRKQKNGGDFVSLRFTFSDIRNISAILLHTANQYKLDAQMFSHVMVWFSMNGVDFSSRKVEEKYLPDTQFNSAKWIRVPIPDRIASVIQVHLYFNPKSSWILLSELKFESNKTRFELPPNWSDDDSIPQTITYYSVNETDASNGVSIVGLLVLMLLFACCLLVVFIFYQKKDRVKASSPTFNVKNREIHLTMNGTVLKLSSPSTYQMTRDNAQNTLLEKCPMISIASDYAEPDISSSSDGSSSVPLLYSFQNQAMETSHYAVTDNNVTQGTIRSNPLSSVVKYSDYGEVYCTTLPEINRNQLIFTEEIGRGEFGEVHLCQLESRQVAVKMIYSKAAEDEVAFQREIRVLGTLKHPNVVEVIGVSTLEKPIICIMEYMANGDLKSFLSKMTNTDTAYCISVATQLAAGLAYLESCNFVHRDIAARNCLVDTEGNVKIADFGMARSLYASEYYKVEGQFVLPIRWMAWESLLLGKFSTQSDVWSFGVTLWEIFSRCLEKPFGNLSDDEVVDNLQHIHSYGQLRHYLPRPFLCPSSVYSQIVRPCWEREIINRPSFEIIHLNLQALIHSPTY